MAERRGRITQPSIDMVLERSDLIDLASGYTQLRKQGAEHLGRCPFHDERSPSFWVNETKGVYHCFGCGVSGDVVTFVQEKMTLDFVETIEYLADRYRVPLEYDEASGKGGSVRRTSKRRLYELTDAAATFYTVALMRSAEADHARKYLASRGITGETAAAFRMGYSPRGDSVLGKKAADKGFTREELNESGLMTSRGSDFFRGRLMVPIIDRADRVIGFGARKLSEDQFGGKYVNSPDGVLFHKKQTVFIAPDIKNSAKAAGRVIVVEGYMDVIALWQAGIREGCAVMGTSLTEQQILELKRLAPAALFAFDPDTAGQVATLRALGLARAQELDVRVVLLTDGDPADIIASDGADRMRELLDESVSLLHYRVSSLLGSFDLSSEEGRERAWREGLSFFGSVPASPERNKQIDRFAFGLGLDSEAVTMLQHASGADKPMSRAASAGGEVATPVMTGRGNASGSGQSSGQARAASPRASAAVMLERRFLAAALAQLESGRALSEQASNDMSGAWLTLGVHQRAWEHLDAVAPGPTDMATVREDAELVALVGELAAIRQRDFSAISGDELSHLVNELALRVYRQALDRQMVERRERVKAAPDDDAALDALLDLRRTLVEVDERFRQLNDAMPVEKS